MLSVEILWPLLGISFYKEKWIEGACNYVRGILVWYYMKIDIKIRLIKTNTNGASAMMWIFVPPSSSSMP